MPRERIGQAKRERKQAGKQHRAGNKTAEQTRVNTPPPSDAIGDRTSHDGGKGQHAQRKWRGQCVGIGIGIGNGGGRDGQEDKCDQGNERSAHTGAEKGHRAPA